MAIGDDAAAAGMDTVLGSTAANTIDTEINKTRDYIAQKTADVTPISKGGTGATSASGARSALGLGDVATRDIVPVSEGGTGATSAGDARSNLGAAPTDHTHPWDDITGKPSTYPPSSHTHPWNQVTGKPSTYPPSPHTHGEIETSGNVVRVTVNGYCDLVVDGETVWTIGPNGSLATGTVPWARITGEPNFVHATGDHMTGNLDFDGDGNVIINNATPVTSSYVAAWINGDGRLGKSASSERFKKYISDQDPAALGDIWPQLARFQMRGGDGSWRYGYIAERLAEVPDQQRFVVYESQTDDAGKITAKLDADGNPIPESIDFFGMLIAQVAQLHQRVTELEQEARK